MALRIPARNLAGDQIMESVTNANTREEQVMRVGGTFSITPTTGAITANGQAVTATSITNAGNLMVMVYGTYVGITPIFEGLISAGGNTTWVPIPGVRIDTNKTEFSPGVLGSAVMAWQFDVSGFDQFRVRATAFTSGTMNVIIDPMVAWGEPVVAANIMNPAGAQVVSYTATNAVGAVGTTEVVIPLAKSVNFGTPGAASATQTVTAGKTFRPMGWVVSHIAGTAAILRAIWNIRVNLAGNVANTSPVGATTMSQNPAATAGSVGTPPPLVAGALGFMGEIPGGAGLGVSNILNAASAGTTSTVSLFGIEY